jgi:hypothetical protein
MSQLEAQATVATVLVIIGALIKHAVPSEGINRWIPIILCSVGTPLFCLVAHSWEPEAIVQGIIASASAVGLHQTAKRTTNSNI